MFSRIARNQLREYFQELREINQNFERNKPLSFLDLFGQQSL